MSLKEAPYLVSKGIGTLVETVTVRNNLYSPIIWTANNPFQATVEFTGGLVGNGNRFEVRDVSTGTVYNIFPADVARYIRSGKVANGQISGEWRVVKRNTAYGIQLL